MCRFVLCAFVWGLAKTTEAAKVSVDAGGDVSLVRRHGRAEDVPDTYDDLKPCEKDRPTPDTDAPTEAPTEAPTSAPTAVKAKAEGCPVPLHCTCLKNSTSKDGNWKLCDTKVEKGAGGMPLRFKQVAPGVDMLLTAAPGYQGENVEINNGRSGCLGQLNVKVPGTATVTFALVKEGTSDTILAGPTHEHEMTIFDTDKATNGVFERVGVSGYSSISTVALQPTEKDGVTWFEAQHAAVKNPHTDDEGLHDLTQAQLDASFSVTYTGTSKWVVQFVAEEPGNSGKNHGGRNYFFSGSSCASASQHTCVCPTTK